MPGRPDILRPTAAVAAVLAFAAALAAPVAARADAPPTAAQLEAQGVRDIIVRRAPGLDGAERADVRAAAGVELAASLRLTDTELVRADAGGLTEALAALRADPAVVY